MISRRRFFDEHAAHWDSSSSRRDRNRLQRVVSESGILSGWKICDVGTGTGVLVPLLARAVGSHGTVIALDSSEEMIRQARKKRFPRTVSLLVADIQRTPLPSALFDAVVCNSCYPHFAHKRRALREIRRILKPGGVLVISHPTGRRFVNELHRSSQGPVRRDRVPPAALLAATLKRSGFVPISMIDEPTFYLVKAVRAD